MNSYLQVAKTYLWRPRFWVLAAAYLVVMSLAFASVDDWASVPVLISAFVACLIVCFVGLHARRQFGGDTAQLIPNFNLPHLFVWWLASTLFWVVIPEGMVLAGVWPSGALAVHAVAGILAGAVAIWPRAIMLLLALPVLMYWTTRIEPVRGTFLDRLLQGELTAIGAALIGAAIELHVIAAIVLIRLPRRGAPTNDEMALNEIHPKQEGPLSDWFLQGRDAAANRLGNSRRLSGVQRWRVPVAIPEFQLMLPAILVALASGIGWLLGSAAEWAVLSAMITSALLLVVPYGVWDPRRWSFNLEMMRPVARTDYVRQIALALAWDVVYWTLIASLICSCVFLLVSEKVLVDITGPRFTIGYLGVLWGLAIFTYGVALAAIRRRMWLLLMTSGLMAWVFGILSLLIWASSQIGVRSPALPVFSLFTFLSATAGLSLAWCSYRRWLATDLA